MEKQTPSQSRQSTDVNGRESYDYGPQRPWPFKKRQSPRTDAYEKRIKRHWYPPLLLSMALNLLLLVGVFYMIYQTDHYKRSRRGFLTAVFLIIFIPLFPVAVLLLWPWDSAWKKHRDAFSERKSSPRWLYVVNIIGGIACFFFVSCYLIFSAVPKYNTAIWETASDFPDDLPVPTIAVFVLNGGDAPAELSFHNLDNGRQVAANLVTVSDFTTLNDTDTVVTSVFVENATVTVQSANFSRLGSTLDTPLQKSLAVTTRLSYNTSSFNDTLGLTPQLFLAAYDARLTVEEGLACAFAQAALPAVFATNTFLLTMKQIHDPARKMVAPANMAPYCGRVYDEILPQGGPPLTVFDLSLMSSVPTNSNPAEECVGDDPDGTCANVAIIVYGTQFITTQRSVPGKSRQDMWIDCGAIVGAVQFFQWLFIVFFQP